jgi:hypothetical protein
MNKLPSRVSSARRNAETILSQSRKREASFKLDQERAQEAMTQKTARLRELRLAKEAADKEAAAVAPAPAKRVRPRRSKQT